MMKALANPRELSWPAFRDKESSSSNFTAVYSTAAYIPKAMGFAGNLFSKKAGKLHRFGYTSSEGAEIYDNCGG